jgi:hypothetical protein
MTDDNSDRADELCTIPVGSALVFCTLALLGFCLLLALSPWYAGR